MTPEERQMLEDLAKKVAATPAPARDPEAEDFIRTHIGNRPDALYIMTQTVLIQNLAIQHAQQEIQQLKQAAQNPAPQAQGGGGFLGHGSGWQTNPPAQPSYQTPSYQTPPQSYTPPSQPGYAPPPPPVQPSAMGGFLRSAGTTAAGVAAGALAFEGIRSMFGGVEHMMGFGQPQFGGVVMPGGFGAGGRPEETVINNYYEGGGPNDRQDQRESFVDTNLGPDASTDYTDTNVPVDDSSDDTSADDFSDNSSDDSSSNDLI